MIVQGSGAVINIILDPILIFVFDMGVAGAAVATVIGQISGALIGFFLVRRIRAQLPVTLAGFRLHPALLGQMCRIAAPAVLIQSLSSLMSLGLNAILTLWSETGVWVLGVYFKLQSFVFMPVFSINNGLISIISYNCGAGERRRVTDAIRFGLITALATALTGAAVLGLCASPLLSVCFHAGAQAMALGVPLPAHDRPLLSHCGGMPDSLRRFPVPGAQQQLSAHRPAAADYPSASHRTGSGAASARVDLFGLSCRRGRRLRGNAPALPRTLPDADFFYWKALPRINESRTNAPKADCFRRVCSICLTSA